MSGTVEAPDFSGVEAPDLSGVEAPDFSPGSKAFRPCKWDVRFDCCVRRFRGAFLKFWQGVRQACGDAAYETYLRSWRASQARQGLCRHDSQARQGLCRHIDAPLTREQFYVEQLRRRYSSVSRCC